MNNSKRVVNFIATNIVVIFCFFLISCGSKSETTPSSNSIKKEASEGVTKAATISLFDDQVSFIIPKGFNALSPKELNKKLPDNTFPEYIYGNADQTGLIIIYLEDFDGKIILTQENLPEVKKVMEGIHQKYSSWEKSEFIEINGLKWFHFDWEEPKIDAVVAPLPPDGEKPEPKNTKTISHYQEYSTSYKNKLLRFDFVADVENYALLKESFTESSQTLKIQK